MPEKSPALIVYDRYVGRFIALHERGEASGPYYDHVCEEIQAAWDEWIAQCHPADALGAA